MKVGKYGTMTELSEDLIQIVETGTDRELDSLSRLCSRLSLLCGHQEHVRKNTRDESRASRLAYSRMRFASELAEVRKTAAISDRDCPWLGAYDAEGE